MLLLVFIRDNFLIFFLCTFWRLKLDPLQMRRGTDQRSNGKGVAARHASRPWERRRSRGRWKRRREEGADPNKVTRERARGALLIRCTRALVCTCARALIAKSAAERKSVYEFVYFHFI